MLTERTFVLYHAEEGFAINILKVPPPSTHPHPSPLLEGEGVLDGGGRLGLIRKEIAIYAQTMIYKGLGRYRYTRFSTDTEEPMGRRLKISTENENLQQTILDSALKLFTTKGYFNTSIQDIRRDANISIGAVYHYFASKEELASALYDSLLEKITADFLAIKNGYDTAHDQCKAIMALLFDLTESNPAQMAFMLYAKHSEFIPTATPICSSRPFTMMREMVQTGIDNKEIVDLDLTIVSNCLFGGMFRLINLRLDNTIAGPLPEQLETVWNCSWRSIAAQPE